MKQRVKAIGTPSMTRRPRPMPAGTTSGRVLPGRPTITKPRAAGVGVRRPGFPGAKPTGGRVRRPLPRSRRPVRRGRY